MEIDNCPFSSGTIVGVSVTKIALATWLTKEFQLDVDSVVSVLIKAE